MLTDITSFSRTKPCNRIYRIPIIFEKVSKKVFVDKHRNHHALLDYPPIGTMWNKTVKYEGIEIKSKTAVISLCPTELDDLIESVSHELIHAYINSFLFENSINSSNKVYLLEGITEMITQLVHKQYYEDN